MHYDLSKFYMIKKLLFILLIWLPVGLLRAQEVNQIFTLDELIGSALGNNFLLKATDKERLIKASEIEILKTNYQPKVTTGASFSYWKFLLPNKQRLLGDALTDMYTDVTVHQTLYDWGESRSKQEVVDREIRVNDEVSRQIRNTIIWGVSDSWFEALKAESEIEVHENSLQQLKSHLQYADNLYQIGRASGVDLLKINVQISMEEKNLEKSEFNLQRQLVTLKRLCYLDDATTLTIEDIPQVWYEKTMNQPLDPRQFYNEALLNHPALLTADHKADIESLQKEIFKLENRPELYSYGIGSWEHGYLPFGKNFNYNIGVGIRYTLPYWGGSSFKHKMAQRDNRIEQIVDEKNQNFQDLKSEIDKTINSLLEIKREMANYEKIIGLSAETINNALVKYQAGQGPIIDILDAQTILTESSIELEKSKILFLQTFVRLHYLTGNSRYPVF